MKVRTLLLAASMATSLTAASWNAGAQDHESADPGAERTGSLTRVEPGALRKVDPWGSPQEQEARAADWELRLVDPDLDARERAFDELMRAAARDRTLADLLRTWARGTDELAWTARLGLRELEGDRLPGFRTPRLLDPFADMERQVEELFGRRLQRSFPPHGLRALAPRGSSTGRSTSIQQGPDGVTVTIEETVDGETTRRTYTGSSLEEIQAANPDLELDVGVGAPELFSFDLDLRGDPFGRLRKVHPTAPRTDILGAYLEPVSDEHVGLRVDRVVPGTIAEALPLNPNDVLLRINGVRMIEIEDVKVALEARDEDGELIVQLVDAEGESHTRSWSPGQGE